MLDIHENNGQLALKAVGLYEKFLEIIHAGGQQGRALDKDGNVRRIALNSPVTISRAIR